MLLTLVFSHHDLYCIKLYYVAIIAGCSRGYVSKHIVPESVEELILCDTNQRNLDLVQVADGIKVKRKVLDEEHIEVMRNVPT